jgi:hypothetical protein
VRRIKYHPEKEQTLVKVDITRKMQKLGEVIKVNFQEPQSQYNSDLHETFLTYCRLEVCFVCFFFGKLWHRGGGGDSNRGNNIYMRVLEIIFRMKLLADFNQRL